MFDPFGRQKRNRNIQKRAQIFRSKGTFSIPSIVIDKKTMDEYASILKANNYKLNETLPFTILGITLLLDDEETIPLTNFSPGNDSYVEHDGNTYQFIINISDSDITFTTSYLNDTTSSYFRKNSWYYLYPHSFSIVKMQFAVLTGDDDTIDHFISQEIREVTTNYTLTFPIELFKIPSDMQK